MTTKKHAQEAPDDDYSFSYVHPSNLDGWDPLAYSTGVVSPANLTAPAEPSTDKKES